MRYYLIAGEASGDLHASNLMRAIKALDPDAVFRCWGGDRMQLAGGEIIRHYRDLAFMGFLEVVLNLKTIRHNLTFCKQDIRDWRPDAVILIDYPGFNLRIAEFSHLQGFNTYYYISPQVWAWKKGRVKTIKKVINRMFVILPFEQDFYKQCGMEVDFVGHPLLDAIDLNTTAGESGDFIYRNGLGDRKIIALLPGSRKQEISRMLPLMLEATSQFPDYEAVVAGLGSVNPEVYMQAAAGYPFRLLIDQTYELLSHSHAALVTSGTASLETALFKVPQVIVYKGSPISVAIAKLIVNVRFIGLPNLIMNKEIVKELIQKDVNRGSLIEIIGELTANQEVRARMQADYTELAGKLGGAGASARVAEGIVRRLKGEI